MSTPSRRPRKTDAAPSPGGADGTLRAYGYRAVSLPPPIRRGDETVRITLTLTPDEARRLALFSAHHNTTPATMARHVIRQAVPAVQLAIVEDVVAPAPSDQADQARARMMSKAADTVAKVRAYADQVVEDSTTTPTSTDDQAA